jgi:hypothetical protein
MAGVMVKKGLDMDRLRKLKGDLEYLNQHTAKIGWVDSAKVHKAEDGAAPVTLAMIARTLNYGRQAGVAGSGRKYPAIPARPFMELTFQKHKAALDKNINRLFGMLVSGKNTGHGLVLQAAEFWKSKIRATMLDSSLYEPLSTKTVENRKRRNRSLRSKQANKPLVDTGALIGSLDVEVAGK